jgi:hypothetical protein
MVILDMNDKERFVGDGFIFSKRVSTCDACFSIADVTWLL